MKNLKKIFAVGLSCLLVFACLAFAACGKKDEHVHTFDSEWSSDENNHWLESTCDHDVRGSEAPHVYINGSNKCTVCDYEKPDDGEQGSEKTYFEAEDALFGGDLGVDVTSEARGGKSVSRFRDALKASVTFFIDSTVAENDVPMTLRLASACEYAGETDHDMSKYDMLTVNGKAVALSGTVRQRMTGWFEWNDVTAKVNLKEGRNVIEVHYDYNGNIKDEQPGWGLCLNFDYIALQAKEAVLTASDPSQVETGIELSIDLTKAKTYYTVGDAVIKDGIGVSVKKLDGTQKALSAQDYTAECDLTSAGEKEVTVAYNNLTAEYTITVYDKTEAVPTSLKLGTDNVKKEYNANAELDLTNLTATVQYDDGSERGINIRDLTADEIDMSEEATVTVTLRYGSLSASYDITVTKYAHTLKLEAEQDGLFHNCEQENNTNVNRFWAESGSSLTFYVESGAAETEAKIVLRLACACEQDGEDHDMSQTNLLKVNGVYVALTGTVVNRMNTSDGSWTNYADVIALDVTLVKGVNKIVLEFEDETVYNRFNIDYVSVSTISAELSSRLYQAEKAENNCESEHTPAASGTDANNLLHIEKADDAITWKINSDVEREVTLVFRLATRKETNVGNLSAYEILTVNNENTPIDGELRDGVWLNFSTFTVTVTLHAGENTITLHGCPDSGNPAESMVKLQVDCLALIF